MYEDVSEAEVERRIAACHESVRAVVVYWREKCAGRPMPGRTDIDPIDLKRFLPSIMLVDVVPDERRFVYRLVGTLEVAGRGYDPTGLSVAEAFYAASLEEGLATYEYVVRERRPFCFREPYLTADNWHEEEDTIYLPLSGDGQNVDKILVYSYSATYKPRLNDSYMI
ncbi:MAG: PAS domain-containing protein [Proteobacteria bacterium]|nr:PAS domain-containing protein [Pseudomonadota bacterium]